MFAADKKRQAQIEQNSGKETLKEKAPNRRIELRLGAFCMLSKKRMPRYSNERGGADSLKKHEISQYG
jgi:hypothetical protein